MKLSDKMALPIDGPLTKPIMTISQSWYEARLEEVMDLESLQDKLIGDWSSQVAALEAELAKLNYIELPNEQASNVFEAYIAWKSKAGKLESDLAQSRADNARLREKAGIAYWDGHTNGRLWGKKAMTPEEIQRCRKQLAATLEANDDAH